MKLLRHDLLSVRGLFGNVHLLVEPAGLTLVDTGLFGSTRPVRQAIARLGRQPGDLKTILITHGHLDHTANAAKLQAWSGAKVFAPAGDELLMAGAYRYRGWARVCGWLEAAGRAIVRYRPPRVDRWLRNGDQLSVWGGLYVVALPGHTPGHVGFYSPTKRVFFVADTFALMLRVALPPPMLSTDTREARASFLKAVAFEADLLVPTHYLLLGPSAMRRVRAKAARLAARG